MKLKQLLNKSGISKISVGQLYVLGIIALSIGFGVVLDGILFYGYPFFNSISASATTHATTSVILPYLLGMMSLYLITYQGYDLWDTILTKIMAVGFGLVAMQPCLSSYDEMVPKIGLLAQSPSVSNIIHSTGAIFGFVSMIIWIGFCFTKSNSKKPTEQKNKRNRWYRGCALASTLGIVWFIIGDMIFPGFPNVWLAEEFILLPIGVAVLIKAESFKWLNDK